MISDVPQNGDLHPMLELQRTFITVDEETIRRALLIAEHCAEFATEVLQLHDDRLGRTLQRHRDEAVRLEQHIKQAKAVQAELRGVLGWTPTPESSQ